MNTHEAVNILTAFHSLDNPFLTLDNPPITGVSESDLSTVQGHSDERHTPNIFAAAQAVLSPPLTVSVSFDSTSSNDSSAENTSSLSRESDRNDIDEFFSLRAECAGNLLLGFLNINSLGNKIIDLRMIAERCLPDVLLIEETKLNSDFKTESFLINNYKSPIRLDRSEFGGGLTQYSRNGIICNRLPNFEVPSLDLLCSELIVAKKEMDHL